MCVKKRKKKHALNFVSRTCQHEKKKKLTTCRTVILLEHTKMFTIDSQQVAQPIKIGNKKERNIVSNVNRILEERFTVLSMIRCFAK